MKWPGQGLHRKLLFRSYLFLVAGLLIVATVLDVSFAYLQSRLGPSEDRWLEQSFRLIEAEIAAAAPGERDAAAARLGRETGFGVQLLDRGDIVTTGEANDRAMRLTDDSGEIFYLRNAPSIAASIRLGPIEPEGASIVLRMLPPLFYLSIAVIVGLWLRPVLRDLNLITRSAQQFAADYRKPLATSEKTTQLTSLARHLDEMSARLGSLIQGQKELTAALSHEMRTPLARIRFALAVVDHGGSDELKKQFEEINADVQEIDELIASILNYARLDHPDLRMNWQCAPLGAWLKLTLEKCRQQNVDIEVIRDEDFNAAWMDPRLMTLALSNLIVNACRYARGKVRLTVARDRRGYRLAVEDDGAGIPETARQAIFKAFTRLDTSRSRDTGRYGLGLAIVARIAALHGGTVAVDTSSALGGARFTLRWERSLD